MFRSASLNALCGVGVPRPNFQRLIEYVEPESEEENAMMVERRRQEANSASLLSEMRIRCPEALLRAAVVGVHPETGQPVVQRITYHHTLRAGVLSPHQSVSRRRSKLMDICQKRLSRDCPVKEKPDEKAIPAKLEVSSQSPSITDCRLLHRVRRQMDFAKPKAKEENLLDSLPVRKKAMKVRTEETKKLTHDKATSMAGFSSSKDANRSVRGYQPKRKSSWESAYINSECMLDLVLRRVMARYRVSASQLSKNLHRLVLEELPKSQVNGERTKIPNSKKAKVHKYVRSATFTLSRANTSQPKALDGCVVKNTKAVDSCHQSSSLATDSQENNELATAAGLTAAFVRRHKLFQLMASQR